jgi:hypothetical protein
MLDIWNNLSFEGGASRYQLKITLLADALVADGLKRDCEKVGSADQWLRVGQLELLRVDDIEIPYTEGLVLHLRGHIVCVRVRGSVVDIPCKKLRAPVTGYRESFLNGFWSLGWLLLKGWLLLEGWLLKGLLTACRLRLWGWVQNRLVRYLIILRDLRDLLASHRSACYLRSFLLLRRD